MIARVAEWLALVALYLLFAGTASLPEGMAAVAAAGFVIFYRICLLRVARPLAVEPRPWLAALPGTAWSLVRDPALVGIALLGALWRGEAPSSGFIATPFLDQGSDPAARGRRALTVLAGSVAPNRYIVALSWPAARMISHCLAGGGSS